VSKRIAAGVLGVLAILCGIAGFGYWLLPLSLGAFWLGADFLKFAVTGQPFRLPQRLRAVFVSLLSFFPVFSLGFVLRFRTKCIDTRMTAKPLSAHSSSPP
jgi:hypothetical protein